MRIYLCIILSLMLTACGTMYDDPRPKSSKPLIRKIPESKTVITREQIEKTGATNVEDLLNRTPPAPPASPVIVENKNILYSSAGNIPGVYGIISHPKPVIEETKMMFVRYYLLPNYELPKKTYANFIFFSRRAFNESEEKIYKSICKKWISLFPDVKEVEKIKVPNNLQFIPFFWLLEKNVDETRNCDVLLENYDYTRAKMMLVSLGLNPDKNFVVCIIPEGTVFMDIDSLINESDVSQAFTAWQNNMSTVRTSPGVVRVHNLFSSVKAVLGALGTLVSFKT